MSVPEVQASKKKTAAMNSWPSDLSPDAAVEGWFLALNKEASQRGSFGAQLP